MQNNNGEDLSHNLVLKKDTGKGVNGLTFTSNRNISVNGNKGWKIID